MAGPDLYVAVDGQQKVVKDAYVAVDGQYKLATQAHVAVDGQQKTTFSPGATYTWTLTPDPGNPYRWTLALAASDASRAVVRGDWMTAPLADIAADSAHTLSWTSQRGPGTPKQTYRQWVELYDRFGRLTEGVPSLSYTPPLPAAPPAPSFADVSESGFRTIIPAQVEAERYIGARTYPGYAEYEIGANHLWGYAASATTYGIKILTVVRGVRGAWSPEAAVTTKAPSYAKGNYTLYPTGSASYSPSYSTPGYYWRPSSEGLRAGNSSVWVPENRGDQSGFVFYNFWDSTHATLREALSRGATITRVQTWLRRRNTAHGYGGSDPRAGLQLSVHPHEGQPGGRPWFTGTHHGGPGWARGEEKWFDLPTWMGYHLVRGDGGSRGFAIGGFFSPYYLFEGVGWGPTGHVVITIA